MTTLDFVGTTQATLPGVVVLPLHDSLWRVTRPSGEVLGYIERSEERSSDRFTAKRFLQRQRRFVPVGDFWDFDDAADCFRF